MYLDSEKKEKRIFEKYGKSNTDTGSPEAQIALFSYRIAHLTEHLKSIIKIIALNELLKCWLVNVVVCSTTSSKSTSTATVHHRTKRVGYQKVIFRYTATKKAIRIFRIAFFVTSHRR